MTTKPLILQTIGKVLAITLTATLLPACLDSGSNSSNSSAQDLSYSGPGSKWDFDLAADGSFTVNRRPDVSSAVDMTVNGTYSRLNTGFIKLTVDSATGQNSPAQGMEAWAIEIPGYALLVKPMESGSDQMIAMVRAGQCPTTDLNANWVLVKQEAGRDTGDPAADFTGTFRYEVASDTPSLPTSYSLTAPTSDLGAMTMPSGSCSSGILTIPGQATMYLTDNGGAVVHTLGNNATDPADDNFIFALAQQPIVNVNALDGDYAGMVFDEMAPAGNKVLPIVMSCTAGNCTGGAVTDISTLDPLPGAAVTVDLTGTVDSPSDGFISGTLTDGTTTASLTCMANTDASNTGRTIVSCVGQSPGDLSKMFNVIFVSK